MVQIKVLNLRRITNILKEHKEQLKKKSRIYFQI